MKKAFKDFSKHVGIGLVIILGGLFLYLILCLSIEYLPFSDRPGPGKYENVTLSRTAIVYILNFLVFLGIYILGTLLLTFAVFKALSLLWYNRIAYAFLGGIIHGILTLYCTVGIGWYIALDGTTPLIGGLMGLLYGGVCLPRILKPDSKLLA